eukprot:gene25560-biopygen22067
MKNTTLLVLDLYEHTDSLVGDGTIRGVSGGQKRRVTLGEMLMAPRRIKFLDAISNGLDAATTYDIIQALKFITNHSGLTTVISLLQPAPEVFYSFTDVILLVDGEIIYHGLTTKALEYFNNLGYHCPEMMDVADFLQEIPTPDGRRFAADKTTITGATPPFGTKALVKAWKESELFKEMLVAMDEEVLSASTKSWPAVYKEQYAASTWFMFKHCLERETRLLMRNKPFLTARIGQSLGVSILAGTLFNNLATDDVVSLNSMLFYSVVFGALCALSLIPISFELRAVFYKHSKTLFYPTWIGVVTQAVMFYPLLIVETIISSTILYWSVGMSDDDHGSRYFSFMFVLFLFLLASTQYFQLLASSVSSNLMAQPLAGLSLVLMILFCGFIIPKKNIPPGWEWFYWINPLSHGLKGVTINEFMAPDYDYLVCADADCTSMIRFGNQVLESYGIPTNQKWVWYSAAILIGLYLFFLVMTVVVLSNLRLEPVPPPPVTVDFSEAKEEELKADHVHAEIPYQPVTFAFKDIGYSVTLPSGENLELLKGVSGYFEPGTVTALMGTSGAGKTTLLDVLAGRKNTGVVTGHTFVNSKPLEKRAFRQMMGYVEQFDTLSPTDTAREAIQFSAALRLPGDTPADIRAGWVSTVLTMLELDPLENTQIGTIQTGGMSFEQKKRVSIGVELAANPSILFLDEPTTGLDSRAAGVVIRCIKRMASSGRSIVCTIHQPSAVIFEAFDSLLLLKRGGQTVYFGELGAHSTELVKYFEALPEVTPKDVGVNPATWMLDVIGAGTNTTTVSAVDFQLSYQQSGLFDANSARVKTLCPLPGDEQAIDRTLSRDLESGGEIYHRESEKLGYRPATSQYSASRWTQFRVLMWRFIILFWRSPVYNFARMLVSTVIALIFASTFVDQKYHNSVDVISRCAVIYITTLDMGYIACTFVLPVMLAERPAFYREQFSEIYDEKLYVLAATLVEIPYLLLSTVMFTIPFFFLVGFDKDGTTDKFFWYWLFVGLYTTMAVFMGHLFAALLPDEASCAVMVGVMTNTMALFNGFLMRAFLYPDFWIFMYWINPQHFVMEGLFVTQFHGDHRPVEVIGSNQIMTAQGFIEGFYKDFHYSARGYDVMALCLFIIAFRVATWYCLKYMKHDKR